MDGQVLSKSDPFRLNEWRKLVNWLLENFEQDELNNVLEFYKKDDSSEEMETNNEEKSCQQIFYDTIDFDQDKLQTATRLHNVMKALRIHSDWGENVAQKVDDFIERLKAYREAFEVDTHQLFIGRDEEVKQVMEIFSNSVAACLSGIGGQGKSLLARTICKKIAAVSPTMKIVKADLRDKRRLDDVMKSLLASAGVRFAATGGQEVLEDSLKQCISESKSDILFCLDDCDQIEKNAREAFLKFLEKMFKFAEKNSHKVRFLLTMREKLIKRDTTISAWLTEVELRALEQSDAEELLKKCSNTMMEKKVASAIVKECACSPLAVTVVAELIKSEKFTPERLLFHLLMDKKNVTQGLKVDRCLKEAIDNLNMNLQEALVCLSVFQSSSFKVEDARRVIDCPENKIQDLYDCHLIEVDDIGGKKFYSLHPLVYRCISEWKKPLQLSAAYKTACQKFVSLYEGKISSIVKLMESKYWKGQRQLEFHRVHILRFYEIMSEQSELLKDHPKNTSEKSLLKKKRVSDLADILLSLVQNRRMFQSEADRALKQKNVAVYVFWMVEKADVFLMLHDKVDIALDILDELSNRYPALRELRDEPVYPSLVHGLFHKVKGLCRWKQRLHFEALDHLKLSIRFYKTPPELNSIFVARIKCYMGQVYLDTGDFDVADQYLREGHQTVKELVVSRERETDELKKELHWDIPRFYYQFARIKLSKAKSSSDQLAKEQLLDRALEDLEKGTKLDQQMKLDYLDGYYSKLKLRADVNIEKGLFMEALDDADHVLDRRRAILQPPHTHYTESVYQVGRIYMLIGNDLNKRGETDKAFRNWRCSSDYFKELKDCHLKDGGIANDNPVFQEIKRDHLNVTELIGSRHDVEQIEFFYRRVEAGDCESEKASSTAAVKKMLWTPVEMMKKFFGGGGKEFGDNDEALTKMENLARVQEERMLRGEPSGGVRRDSGMGHSSSDYGESLSSGSGSMSERMNRLHLEKSVSIEDEVFQESHNEQTHAKSAGRSKKRQKTIDEGHEV